MGFLHEIRALRHLKLRLRNPVSVAVAILVVLALISLGKLLAYETQSKTGLLRENIGRQVVLSDGPTGGPLQGTLVSVRYRLNDVVGFFDLEIMVYGDTAGMGTGLEPWNLSRVIITGK